MKFKDSYLEFNKWLYQKKITVMFNFYGALFFFFLMMISGFGEHHEFKPTIMKIPDGVVYTPKNNGKKPGMGFYLDEKKYTSSCPEYKEPLCQAELTGKKLRGYDVIHLVPYPSAPDAAGLILEGRFELENGTVYLISNYEYKNHELEVAKFSNLILKIFYYSSYIYLLIVLLLVFKIIHIKFYKGKNDVRS